MPYRILLTYTRRAMRRKSRQQGHGGSLGLAAHTNRVEIRSDKGLLLFYRPPCAGLKMAAPDRSCGVRPPVLVCGPVKSSG